MKKVKISLVLSLVLSALLCLTGGCQLIAIASNPTSHEKRVKAEYSIPDYFEQNPDAKILVLVDQPSWITANTNLRYKITKKINSRFVEEIKSARGRVVGYADLARLRAKYPDFNKLSPSKVGELAGADLVLHVTIDDYKLYQLSQEGYYNGFLNTSSRLYEVSDGMQLWPVGKKDKKVDIRVEVESGGKEVIIARMSAGTAHCIVRHLYNCPKTYYRIMDEKVEFEIEDW